MNLLFVCSRNKWRSPTAENIFKDHSFYRARSAGVSESARIRMSEKLVEWADIIFVMEKNHKEKIEARYSTLLNKSIVVLDIPDEYQYMDPELIHMIKLSLQPYLAHL